MRYMQVAALGLALMALQSGVARAAFVLTLIEDGNPIIAIADGDPLDISDPTNTPDGVILVDTSGLNVLLTHFNFTDLSSESNRLAGAPFSNDVASVSQNGQALRTDTAGVHTIDIIASDTDFLFPSGNPKVMSTSASDTFRNTTAGDVRTFQSFFDPSNTGYPAVGITSPLLVFAPPAGAGPFSTSNPGVDTPLGVHPIPYALYNYTSITLGANISPTQVQRDQFTGATVIVAIPEPASMSLMAVGFALSAFAVRSHRARSRVA